MDTPMHPPDRRRFLSSAAAAATLLAAHDSAAEESPSGPSTAKDGPAGPRLRRLELRSSAPLAKMAEFYQQTLGLRVLEDAPGRLTIDAGQTRLTFLRASAEDGKPFYHFAFNIPENKILA